MNATGPVLVGLVIGLVVASLNNRVDDEIAAGDETGLPVASETADEGDSSSSSSNPDDDDDPEDDPDEFPDTGGADVPELPAGSGGNGTVTLTFDDGPHPTYTPQVLDMLAANDVPAVFCVVGENVRKHPELVRRIVDEGHALCNHSYTHDDQLAQRSRETIEQEIADTADAIDDAIPGAEVPFFRQPAMYVTPEVAPVARDHGLTILDWTLDTRDWARPGASTIVDRVLSNVQPGTVVLLHDGGGDRSQTVKALKQLVVALEASGYETVIPTTSSPAA